MAEIETRAATSESAGLRALLAEVVDYAGVFPPASLSLDEAISNYAAYRRSEDAWMLAAFIIPAKRLSGLEPHTHFFEEAPTFRFSVLPTGGQTGDDMLDALRTDLKAVRRFVDAHRKFVRVEQFEIRLPEEFVNSDVVRVRRFLDSVDKLLEEADVQDANLFVEIPLDEYLRQTLPLLTGAVAIFNRDRAYPEIGRAAVKMRTGGTEADAFPSCEDVAHVITSCRNTNVPFKATAGLHHPVRHHNESVRTRMHGFLNLFGASVLACAHSLDEEAVASILRDEDPSHFTISSDGIDWSHLSASVDAIERARSSLALSFGSCSFMEPVEDLRELGLL